MSRLAQRQDQTAEQGNRQAVPWFRHPARFVLVGSGNPEEGELRPQLLDRFGMHAEIRTVKDPILRVKVVEERTSFDQSPMVWIENYESQQQELRDKIGKELEEKFAFLFNKLNIKDTKELVDKYIKPVEISKAFKSQTGAAEHFEGDD